MSEMVGMFLWVVFAGLGLGLAGFFLVLGVFAAMSVSSALADWLEGRWR